MQHGGQGPARYLGGSHHCRCGRHVQASLPEVHKGVVTPVLSLDKAIIDFLSKENRDTLSGGFRGSLFFLPSPGARLGTLPSHGSPGTEVTGTLGVCESKYEGGGREAEGVQGNGKGDFETQPLTD